MFNNSLYAFHKASGSSLGYCRTSDGVNWSTPAFINAGVSVGNGPDVVVFNNKLYMFYINESNGYIAYQISSDGVNWSATYNVGADARSNKAPSAAVYNGVLYLLHKTFSDNNPYTHITTTTDGISWSPELEFQNGAKTAENPHLEIIPD